MKMTLKPIAAAVGLALVSVSAHAQLAAPAYGTTVPTSDTLYLAVWDSNGNNSEVVNLSYLDSAVTAASGALTPNSATSPFTTAVNPSTGSGNVLELNFGTVPDFSTLFTSSNIGTADFMVLAAHGGGSPYAEVTSAAKPVTTYTGMTGLVQNVQSEISDWAADINVNTSGVAGDTTGTTTWSVQNGPLKGGQVVTGQQFGGSVGSSLGFYDMVPTTSGLSHTNVITPYANANGAGFWFLSTSGDLTWNVPLAASTVPLPAAVWLLGSGLLGLAGIGRRRLAA